MSLLAGVQWRYVASALNELLCQAAKKKQLRHAFWILLYWLDITNMDKQWPNYG